MQEYVMPIRIKPYKHQIDAYNFALEKYKNSRGVAYLMEMGTGKTLTTIAVIGELMREKKIKKVLIVSPMTIVSVWKDEFEKFAKYEYSLAALEGTLSKK